MTARKTTTRKPARKPATKPARKPATRKPAASKREPASIVPAGDMGYLESQGMRSAVTGENLSMRTLPPSGNGLYTVRVRRTDEGDFDHFEVSPYIEEAS